MRRALWTARAIAFGLVVVTSTTFGGVPQPSFAQIAAPLSTASDARALFVSGNVVTCAGAGVIAPGTSVIQVGAHANNSAADVNVSGVVTPRPGGGEEVSITITGPNVVVDAVVVKGGNGYNIYTNPAVLPPALAPADQHYISPFNGGTNVPAVSHWFVCYHETVPLDPGTLLVTKSIQAPPGMPVTPLPTSFSAIVNCIGDPNHQNVTVNFGSGGGKQSSPLLTGIPIGTVCTVNESGGGAPVVTYSPVGANNPGVTITEGAGVVVNIANDFSSVPVQRGIVRFTKVLIPPPAGVTPPSSFTVEIACDDGTRAFVTLPGTGGFGTPDVSVRSLSLCALTEDTSSLSAGWTLSYSVDGGPPSATPPFVPVRDASTIIVTVTNDASAALPPLPPSTAPGTIAPTTIPAAIAPTPGESTTTTIFDPGGGMLPATGQSLAPMAIVAALLIFGGVAITAARRTHRPN